MFIIKKKPKNAKKSKGLRSFSAAESIPLRPLLVTIYGEPGLGKTSLAFTSKMPFLYDFDNGVIRAHKKRRPETFFIDDYTGLKYFVQNEMPAFIEETGYKSVIFDTGGTLLDDTITPWLISQNAKNGNLQGGLSQSGWGVLSIEFDWLIKAHQALGLDVILICHEKQGEDSRIGLDVKGGSKGIIHRSSDLIGNLYYEGKNRILTFGPKQGYILKDSAELGSTVLPHVDTVKFDSFFANLIDRTKNYMSALTDAQKAFLEQVETIKARLLEVETFQELEALRGDTGTLPETVQAMLRAPFAARFAAIYSDANFEGLQTVEDFNDILPSLANEVPNLPDYKNEVFKRLLVTAKKQEVAYDKTDKKFLNLVLQ
ncbi:MAG: AAA family ATPase [Richelia sp. SL_2_1]|nr:AAA family ATPase [Richelia sp. SL_2_1]